MDGRVRLVGYPADLAGRSWTGPDLDLRVRTYEGARALPLRAGGPGGQRILGCVYDRAGRVVVDSERAKLNRAWAGNPSRMPAPEDASAGERLPGRTLFAGHRRPAFGHFLLEIMPRLWPELDYRAFDHVLLYPTRVGERSRGPLDPYAVDLLSALGVDASRIVMVDRLIITDELTVTTPALVLKHAVDPRLVDPFDRATSGLLGADLPPTTRPRIYLSRSRLSPRLRRAENEAQIEALLRTLGFEVLHPQEMSITAQIAAVRAAAVIAGCDGSALHLAAFARPGTTLLAIDSRLVENQLMLDVVRGIDAVHVLAPVHGPTLRDEPWLADLDLVSAATSLAGLEE